MAKFICPECGREMTWVDALYAVTSRKMPALADIAPSAQYAVPSLSHSVIIACMCA